MLKRISLFAFILTVYCSLVYAYPTYGAGRHNPSLGPISYFFPVFLVIYHICTLKSPGKSFLKGVIALGAMASYIYLLVEFFFFLKPSLGKTPAVIVVGIVAYMGLKLFEPKK